MRGQFLSVEPGFTRSSFEQSMAAPDQPLSVYETAHANASHMVFDSLKTADTSESVAQTIVRVAAAENPKLRYTSGTGVGRLAMLRRYIPASGLREELATADASAAIKRSRERTAVFEQGSQ